MAALARGSERRLAANFVFLAPFSARYVQARSPQPQPTGRGLRGLRQDVRQGDGDLSRREGTHRPPFQNGAADGALHGVGRQRGRGPHGHGHKPSARVRTGLRPQHGPCARVNRRQQNALLENSVKCESCMLLPAMSPHAELRCCRGRCRLQAVFPGRARRPAGRPQVHRRLSSRAYVGRIRHSSCSCLQLAQAPLHRGPAPLVQDGQRVCPSCPLGGERRFAGAKPRPPNLPRIGPRVVIAPHGRECAPYGIFLRTCTRGNGRRRQVAEQVLCSRRRTKASKSHAHCKSGSCGRWRSRLSSSSTRLAACAWTYSSCPMKTPNATNPRSAGGLPPLQTASPRAAMPRRLAPRGVLPRLAATLASRSTRAVTPSTLQWLVRATAPQYVPRCARCRALSRAYAGGPAKSCRPGCKARRSLELWLCWAPL